MSIMTFEVYVFLYLAGLFILYIEMKKDNDYE